MQKRTLAAIDVGSNSLRLMVAEADGERVTPLAARRLTTRMISGVVNGYLTEQAIEDNAGYIAGLCKEARSLGAEAVYAFGTSAMRDAKNREALNDRVEALCGLRIALMSGAEEAQLAYGGCAPAGRCGVIDIGGGSSEVICGADGLVSLAVSAQMGAVRLMNQWGDNPLAADGLTDAARAVLRPVVSQAKDVPVDRFIGVGGTVTTMAAMTWGVSKYTPEAIENCPITREGAQNWLERLLSLSLEERRTIAGLPPHRADVIPFGAAILCALMDEVGAPVVYATDHDNLEGYLRMRMLTL